MVQPADVGIFHILKAGLHAKWDRWFLDEEHQFTNNMNLKSPGYAKVIVWLSELWEEFDSAVRKKSFVNCGITSLRVDELHSVLRAIVGNEEEHEDFVVERQSNGADEMRNSFNSNDKNAFAKNNMKRVI